MNNATLTLFDLALLFGASMIGVWIGWQVMTRLKPEAD